MDFPGLKEVYQYCTTFLLSISGLFYITDAFESWFLIGGEENYD